MASNKHEWQVIYPSRDASDVDLTTDDNFAVIDELEVQEKTPVVILLGWAGCVDKHIAKYSAIYEQKRFITMRHTFPANSLFFKYNQIPPMAKRVLEIIYEQELEDHPIIFHIFSNGGTFVYCHLTNLIQHTEKFSKLKIKGCIIDSAPGKRRILKATKAFMSTLKVHFILKYFMGFCIMVFLFFSRIFGRFLASNSSQQNPFHIYDQMCEDSSKWPQLFLFSRKDNVILHEDVQEVVNRRKQLGITVWETMWDDSDHVAHLRTHREAYIQKCIEFSLFCLKSKL